MNFIIIILLLLFKTEYENVCHFLFSCISRVFLILTDIQMYDFEFNYYEVALGKLFPKFNNYFHQLL